MKDDANIEIQFILINEFGEFKGKKFLVNQEQYDSIIQKSKKFYESSGFELTCVDNEFVIFSPEIVKKSILKISSKIIE